VRCMKVKLKFCKNNSYMYKNEYPSVVYVYIYIYIYIYIDTHTHTRIYTYRRFLVPNFHIYYIILNIFILPLCIYIYIYIYIYTHVSSRLLSKNLKIKVYRNIILPVVLHGYKTWSLTLREERRLRVFENRVLRRIFGPKRDEVTREWRKLHNEELNDLYSSPSIVRVIKSRRIRWAGHVARMGERRVVYRVLVGKTEVKRLLDRPRCRWEVHIKVDIQEVGCGGMDRIVLAKDRALVNEVTSLRVP